MSEKKIARKEYRGENLTKDDLINKLQQLQRLGQLQGDDIDWKNLGDYFVADNDPAEWLNEEAEEVDKLITGKK